MGKSIENCKLYFERLQLGISALLEDLHDNVDQEFVARQSSSMAIRIISFEEQNTLLYNDLLRIDESQSD